MQHLLKQKQAKVRTQKDFTKVFVEEEDDWENFRHLKAEIAKAEDMEARKRKSPMCSTPLTAAAAEGPVVETPKSPTRVPNSEAEAVNMLLKQVRNLAADLDIEQFQQQFLSDVEWFVKPKNELHDDLRRMILNSGSTIITVTVRNRQVHNTAEDSMDVSESTEYVIYAAPSIDLFVVQGFTKGGGNTPFHEGKIFGQDFEARVEDVKTERLACREEHKHLRAAVTEQYFSRMGRVPFSATLSEVKQWTSCGGPAPSENGEKDGGLMLVSKIEDPGNTITSSEELKNRVTKLQLEGRPRTEQVILLPNEPNSSTGQRRRDEHKTIGEMIVKPPTATDSAAEYYGDDALTGRLLGQQHKLGMDTGLNLLYFRLRSNSIVNYANCMINMGLCENMKDLLSTENRAAIERKNAEVEAEVERKWQEALQAMFAVKDGRNGADGTKGGDSGSITFANAHVEALNKNSLFQRMVERGIRVGCLDEGI